MNTSLSWIKRYVPDLDVDLKTFCDGMTLSGTKVEGATKLDANLEKIVVGQVKSCEMHPDSDHLHVCMVDVGGDEDIQIVCGAPNVATGQKVPVVLDGGRVAGSKDGKGEEGGIKIKKGKLRGVESNGMICSIEELGSSHEMFPESPEYGIYVFPEDTPVGADAVELLGLRDAVVEYEITSNRVDCYSVIGIAREAAATFHKDFHAPVVTVKANDEDVNDYIKIEVEDKDLCTRYCARVIKNVKIGPSPKWMQRCLASNGIRPINNIVDITNYIMEEYGQPMHAYDYNTIAGKKIVVKRAKDGDTFVTLDGQERKLDKDVLTINDGEKAVGLAGIMGGENSMITEDATTVLFEAACFDGTNIRLSSKRIGLQTDASGKFDKGLDANTTYEAINRACQLIEEFGCGEVVGGVVDVYDTLPTPKKVSFDPKAINKLLGSDYPEKLMIDIFEKVELSYDPATNMITVPTWRQDVLRTCDLAEEVARFYGYDKIPTTLPAGEATAGGLQFDMRINEMVRQIAEDNGFSQAYCYSFESPKVFDKLLLDENDSLRQAIEISNPLGEDFSIMRTSSLNGILTSLGFNSSHRNKNVRLYEMGNVYLPKSLPLTELPDERMKLTLGFYGEGDFFDMKGIIEMILTKLGLKKVPEYAVGELKNYLHPGRQAEISYEGENIGFLGEVHPTVRKTYGIQERAIIAVIDMPTVDKFASFDRKFIGIARFPAVSRDISMLVPHAVTNGEIEKVIIQRGGKLLESCRLFDIYEGAPVQAGYKSMAYNLTFRNKEKTMEEADIATVMKKILNGLEQMGISLRS